MSHIKWLVQFALIIAILGSMVYAAEVSPSPQPSLTPTPETSSGQALSLPQYPIMGGVGKKGGGEGEKEAIQIPDVVATINGVNITGQEIKRRIAQSRAMDPDRFDSMSLAERGEAMTRVIDNMVMREVIYQEAVRKGTVVTDEEIGMSLNDLKRQFLSEEAFEKAFAGANITIPAWKEETRKSLMGLKLEGLMVEEVKISKSEIAEYYEKNKGHLNRDSIKVSHILVKTEEEARKVSREIKKNKKNFGDLAEKYSIDPYTKDKRGDLGWYGKGNLIKEVEEAAYSLSQGQISGPVKSPYGYHIIRLDGKKRASGQTLEDHREHVESILRQVKWQQLKFEWVKTLMDIAVVWKWSPL